MTYDELVAAISDASETTFTTDEVNLFITQTEKLCYQSVDLLPMETEAVGATVSGNKFVAFPTGFVSPISLSVTVASNELYLLPKDVTFIREAYPNASTTGVPQHYGLYDTTQFILGPTPGAIYTVNIRYESYPESIVDAGTTWLGDNFDPVLLNGSLVQAARFLKLEEDVVKNYAKLYLQSIALLKSLGSGKLRQDMYREGYTRSKVA